VQATPFPAQTQLTWLVSQILLQHWSFAVQPSPVVLQSQVFWAVQWPEQHLALSPSQGVPGPKQVGSGSNSHSHVPGFITSSSSQTT
jgi:hypothetical protein